MDQPNDTAMLREMELEKEMQSLGYDLFMSKVGAAKQKGLESTTPYGQYMMKHAIDPVVSQIGEFMARADSGKPGRRHLAVKYLRLIDPKVSAFIIIKTVLDGLSRPSTLTQLALAIANNLEAEVRFSAFEGEKPKLFRKIASDLHHRTTNREWKQRVLVHSMNKADVNFELWPKSDKLHLGTACLEFVRAGTGFIDIVTLKTGHNRLSVVVQPTPEATKLTHEHTTRCSLLSPAYLPTVVPPRPWRGAFEGGYYFLVHPVPLVKTFNNNYLEELGNRHFELASVFEAVNHVQATPWAINRDVLSVLREVWDRHLPHGGLPAAGDEDLPPKPANIETDEASLKAWKKLAAQTHEYNAKVRGSRIQVSKIIWVAEKLANEPAIYFPHQMDFRGRIYPIPVFLNPQGADYAKALLRFSEGKPIEDERAAGWLMIHGANLYGHDKVSLEDRIGWVEENRENILASADSPLSNTFWCEADKPWQFLAFCFEYAGLIREGYGFVSHLPVALDGSCNGLQHFSAMLRDEVGGKAVNLLPSEEPEDIYQRVADRVVAKLEDAAANNPEGGKFQGDYGAAAVSMARQWLTFGVDRKVTKRPVMVLPYGGTLYSCRQYIEDYVRERVAGGTPNPWGDDIFHASMFLARLVWSSIGEVVIAARKAMDWLQAVAKIAASDGLPVMWHTPDGFPVLQAYPNLKARRIKTKMGDQLIWLSLAETTDRIDNARQALGISPNFVHSLDATALRSYVRLAKNNGIASFALVHDSYGTHAADTDMSAACLRHAFMDMYENHRVLEEFRDELRGPLPPKLYDKLPPLPEMGELDIQVVRDAEYFFA